MHWPALSPELNHIEHLGDEVQRRLNNFKPKLTTADKIAASFLRVCNDIPITFFNRLVHSCSSVINTNGGHACYGMHIHLIVT